MEPWAGNYGEEVPQYQAFNHLKQMHPGLKTVIAVGGWTFNDPGATQIRFSNTANTAANRAAFAASCVDFCREYGFDGVDLDWEYPGDTSRRLVVERLLTRQTTDYWCKRFVLPLMLLPRTLNSPWPSP